MTKREIFSWKLAVKEKLLELLGMGVIAENACPLKLKIVEKKACEGFEPENTKKYNIKTAVHT